MSKLWSRRIKDIEPYVPGEQPVDRKYIKLNTNENPYPPSPKVLEAIKLATDQGLRLYPDPLCGSLVDAIGDFYQVDQSKIFVGNGSDEVLAFAFLAFFNPGDKILYPDITYSFYPVYSDIFEVGYELIPLSDCFDITVDDYKTNCDGVIIANPNAPTGKLLPIDAIREILTLNVNKVVIVDEAYIDFGGTSAVSLIDEFDNLLVVQTMSKSRSLAGMRIGFAIGSEGLIEGLNRVKNSINSYTLDKLALVAGVEAMKDQSYFDETRKAIIDTRTWVVERLKKLEFDVPDSKANFVFAAPQKIDAKSLFLGLKEKGILVRYFDKPRINGYLRITIGTNDEMTILLDTIEMIQNKS